MKTELLITGGYVLVIIGTGLVLAYWRAPRMWWLLTLGAILWASGVITITKTMGMP